MTDTPPNLRLSDSDEDCGGCRWFNDGFCSLYRDYPVDDAMVCDSYEPKADDDA